jgi:DNA-binding FadR family transcriptional regulator
LIKRHFDRMCAAHRSGDADEHARADADFHLAICDASHNFVVMHIFRSFEELQRSNVFHNRKQLFQYRVNHQKLLDEHAAIFAAVMKNDPDGARNAARLHITHTIGTVREIQEAQKRLEVATRRLQPSQLVAQTRRRAKDK